MKKPFPPTTIVIILVLFTNEVQSQTISAKLDQVELMKQFIGSWKCNIAKDTISFWDAKFYGTGLDCNYRFVTNEKVIKEGKQLWGYDRKTDKFIWSLMDKGGDIEIYAAWFISKTKYIEILYSYILSPEKTSWKCEGEFRTPDMMVETTTINNKSIRTDTYTRIME
jgi:hypothetical protein